MRLSDCETVDRPIVLSEKSIFHRYVCLVRQDLGQCQDVYDKIV